MSPKAFEVAGLATYGAAIAFLYWAVSFLGERDYVAALLCAGVGLAVARLAGDLLRYALWRQVAQDERAPDPSEPPTP